MEPAAAIVGACRASAPTTAFPAVPGEIMPPPGPKAPTAASTPACAILPGSEIGTYSPVFDRIGPDTSPGDGRTLPGSLAFARRPIGSWLISAWTRCRVAACSAITWSTGFPV